jgi:hypothetical protein
MSETDYLISSSLQLIVKQNLGELAFNKIEKRLFECHRIGFTEASEDFKKIDVVLREFFGKGAEGVEKQILL